jgi:hypothetical protein
LVLLAVLAAVSGGGAALLSRLVFPYLSIDNDEPLYRLQAQVIANGHLFPSAPAPKGSYVPWLAAVHDGHYVLKYTPLVPGWHALSYLLTGGFALGLAVLAALLVVVTYRLALELLGQPWVALLAAGLTALSPLVVVQSALLLPYLPTLLLLELFVWMLVRGVRRTSGWCLPLAGLAAAAAFTIRPYDTLLFVVPMLVWAAFGPLSQRRLWAAGRLALGAVLPLAGLLAYNAAATGHPFRLPFNALESKDALGFGVRKLYPGDKRHDFGIVQGLAGVGDHLTLLAVWIAGGALLLVLGIVAGLRRRLSPPLLALAVSGAVFTIGYIGFWGAWNAADLWGGIRYVGPFYLMPVLLPVVLCGARGLADLLLATRRAAVATGGVAVTAILAVAGVVLGFAISGNAHFTSQDRRLTALLDRPGQSVVFVATDPPFLMHPSAVLSNKPLKRFDRSSDPDRLFAVSRGSADLTVLDTHPDQRTPWLLRIHGALAKHLHVGETAQLYALRDLRGQQVVVPVTLTAPIGTAGLQLQVSTGKQKLTYELPTSGTTVQLRVRSGQLEVAGLTPDRVEQLRTPVSGLQLALLQRPAPSAPLRVLDQQRLALSQDGDNVRLLVPGRLMGVVGKPGPTWLAFPTG